MTVCCDGISEHQARSYARTGEPDAPVWQRALLRHKRDAVRRCLRELGADEAPSILDVGCNDGAVLVGLAENGESLWGMDISASCLAAARQRGIRTVAADASQGLPFDSGTFDLVLASEIIEHIYDTDRFLAEVFRVLKRPGLVVVTTPNINCLRNRFLVPFGRYPYGPGHALEGSGHGVHIRAYNVAILAAQMVRTGFSVLHRWSTHLLPVRLSATSWGFRVNRLLGRAFPTLGSDIIVVGRKG